MGDVQEEEGDAGLGCRVYKRVVACGMGAAINPHGGERGEGAGEEWVKLEGRRGALLICWQAIGTDCANCSNR